MEKTYAPRGERKAWKNKTPVVTPGLAPGISALMARRRMNLPSNIPTRELETYFKNMDMVDIKNAAEKYNTLKDKLIKNNEEIKRAKEKAQAEQKADYERFKEFMTKQQLEQKTQVNHVTPQAAPGS